MATPTPLPPLGPDDSVSLFDCLEQSLSQDSLVQKSAEAALEQYERRPNFCACLAVSCNPLLDRSTTIAIKLVVLKFLECQLQEILRSKQADHSVRWLAAVQFKNTIAKRWRPKGGLGYDKSPLCAQQQQYPAGLARSSVSHNCAGIWKMEKRTI